MENLIEVTKNLIRQSLLGAELESPKVEFKAKWHILKGNEQTINEFLKDITAMTNTVGLDGFLIFGYDDKKKEIIGAEFAETGLRDTSDLTNLIIKRCSNLFEFSYREFIMDDKILGVLHLPPNLDKPVFIKNYQTFDKKGKAKQEPHRVFVRKNSRVFPASRYDFDMMYYDRKNIAPEYLYALNLVAVNYKKDNMLKQQMNPKYKLENIVNLHFIIENLGVRNLIITGIKIELTSIDKSFKFAEVTTRYPGGTVKVGPLTAVTIRREGENHLTLTAFDNRTNEILDLNTFEKIEVGLILANGRRFQHEFRIENIDWESGNN